MKLFWLQIFSICHRHQWCTLSCEYLLLLFLRPKGGPLRFKGFFLLENILLYNRIRGFTFQKQSITNSFSASQHQQSSWLWCKTCFQKNAIRQFGSIKNIKRVAHSNARPSPNTIVPAQKHTEDIYKWDFSFKEKKNRSSSMIRLWHMIKKQNKFKRSRRSPWIFETAFMGYSVAWRKWFMEKT